MKLMKYVNKFSVYFCQLQMTTKYIVKRCSTFGFAQTLRNAITLFQPDEYNSPTNIFYVHSSKSEPSSLLEKLNSNTVNITNINDIVPNKDERNIFFVELGVKSKQIVKVPIEWSDDKLTIGQFCSTHDIPDDFEHAVLAILDDSNEAEELKEHKFSDEFIQFLIDLYPKLRD